MIAPTLKLITQLLAQPRLQSVQNGFVDSFTRALVDQGLTVQGEARETFIDTGVGRMRRMSQDLREPLSGALMELQVFLLAKVDGAVHCWSELWSTQPKQQGVNAQGVSRMVNLGAGVQVELPRRLRLVRTNHFEGHVGKAWAKQPDALELAHRKLTEQGLVAGPAAGQAAAELARAVLA